MRDDLFIFILFALVGVIEPHAAVGAAFGCCFNLALPKTDGESRVLLPLVSLGLGYGAGVAMGEPHALWAAIVVAALGSTLLTVAHSIILNQGDMPDWFKYIVETALRVRK